MLFGSLVLNPLAFFLFSFFNMKICGLRCLQFFKSWPPVYNGGLKFEHVINHCENFTSSILVKTLKLSLKKTLNTIWAHHQPHSHCCSSSTLTVASFSVTVYYQPISFTQNPNPNPLGFHSLYWVSRRKARRRRRSRTSSWSTVTPKSFHLTN